VYASHSAPLIATAPPRTAGTPGPEEADSLLGSVGRTPLLRLRRVVGDLPAGVEVWAKAEFLNPTGSVKDRAARAIVESARADGRLAAGRTLIDASSGNTGISYAMMGAHLGFAAEICLPQNASPERVRRLRAYGATVVFTDPTEGTDGAQREARRRASADPDRYFYADQYHHPANPGAHFAGTGPEIWRQTHGRITHFIAGVGTGGTVSGTGRFLKQQAPPTCVIGVEPDGPLHGIEGLKHLPSASIPGTYDASVVDRTVRVSTEAAQDMARRLAREEGLLTGTSSGAAVAAAVSLLPELVPPAVVVAILPDGGDRYFSEAHWEFP
jgi:cysteine synthase B